jgi:hypothetical protein
LQKEKGHNIALKEFGLAVSGIIGRFFNLDGFQPTFHWLYH